MYKAKKYLAIFFGILLAFVIIELSLVFLQNQYFERTLKQELSEIKDPSHRVIILGDSMSTGKYAWPLFFDKKINNNSKNLSLEIINLAIPGKTSKYYVNNIENIIEKYEKIDFVIIMLGNIERVNKYNSKFVNHLKYLLSENLIY
ncbi:SGNH/GDSL hydrolase family protein, partial [archaeon]|nr:SGNH/GDSL hydrolase family protein [archaeon]